MANVAIVPLPQAGHIYPTLSMAAAISAAGHTVTYLVGACHAPLFSDTGSRCFHMESTDPILVKESILQLSPDLLLLDRVVAEQGYRSLATINTKRVVYSTSLLNWNQTLRLREDEPVLILCPESLEVPKYRHSRPNLHYAEPSVQPEDVDFVTPSLVPRILCAFGTQSIRHPRLLAHYHLVIAVARLLPEYHFLLVAPHHDFLDVERIPGNACVVSQVRQRQELARSAAFVTHGGLGGLKETILAGVPTLVLPSFGDQFFNAMRVRYHELGEALFDENQEAKKTADAVERIVAGRFDIGIAIMRADFNAKAQESLSYQVVENTLKSII